MNNYYFLHTRQAQLWGVRAWWWFHRSSRIQNEDTTVTQKFYKFRRSPIYMRNRFCAFYLKRRYPQLLYILRFWNWKKLYVRTRCECIFIICLYTSDSPSLRFTYLYTYLLNPAIYDRIPVLIPTNFHWNNWAVSESIWVRFELIFQTDRQINILKTVIGLKSQKDT